MSRPISWRRNLAVLSGVQVISTLGFGLIFPFLPLYVRDLGVSTGGSLEFWAGLVFSAQAFTMMIASPIASFPSLYSQFQRALGASERVFDFG